MFKKTINWDAVAAIGQLISGAAVVLTLYLLTTQLRYAEIAASDANRLSRTNGVIDFWLEAAHDPDFRRNAMAFSGRSEFVEEIARRLEVTELEATQLEASAHYWFWLHWGQWSTTMEERDLAEVKAMVQNYYTLPQVRMVWESHRGWMTPEFEAFVDAAIAEVDEGRAPQRSSQVSFEELTRKLDELQIGVPLHADTPSPAQGD